MTPRQTTLSALVYEYSHARSCEAAYRVRITRSEPGPEAQEYRACVDHWVKAAREAAKRLKDDFGLELPGADIGLG